MNAVPDYSYGKSTVVVKFSNSKYTDDSFSIVKDPVSKEILKNCGPRTQLTSKLIVNTSLLLTETTFRSVRGENTKPELKS
jgi:hypothetical protein